MLEIITTLLIIVFTILLFFLYRFLEKISGTASQSGVLSQYFSKNKQPNVHDYQLAYDLVYQEGVPQPYDDCAKYNEWVRTANKRGKEIIDECNKAGLKDCPRGISWLETKC